VADAFSHRSNLVHILQGVSNDSCSTIIFQFSPFLPRDAMRCAVLVIVILSVCLSVCPSVCHTRRLCPHGSTYDHDFFTIMAIFASFVHCLPNILHTWPHDSFHVIRLSMTLAIFQGQYTVSHQISHKRYVIRQKLL